VRGGTLRHPCRRQFSKVIENGRGETVLTTTIEGRRAFPVRVRYAPQYRADPQALGQCWWRASRRPDPAGQVATHRAHARAGDDLVGKRTAARDGALNVQGRDVGGFVQEARAASRATCRCRRLLHRLERAVGEPGQRRQRLQIVLPIVRRDLHAAVLSRITRPRSRARAPAVPFALTGGVYLLWLLGYNFSVAVWVGFIALFGPRFRPAS
jgi:Cu(I)/Ag(I) efflux system membrane protein CusA/SilA